MSRIPGGPSRPELPPLPRRHLAVATPDPSAATSPMSAVGESVPMTAVEDGLAHEVGAEDLSAGSVAGRYRALCGAVIGPAALTVPAGAPCRCCAVEVAPGPEAAGVDARRSRRAAASWLRALRARTARRDAGSAFSGVADDVAA